MAAIKNIKLQKAIEDNRDWLDLALDYLEMAGYQESDSCKIDIVDLDLQEIIIKTATKNIKFIFVLEIK